MSRLNHVLPEKEGTIIVLEKGARHGAYFCYYETSTSLPFFHYLPTYLQSNAKLVPPFPPPPQFKNLPLGGGD